ncbi:MAG TPA: glycosyltransferase family 4 protein [Gaiella sp.]|nr:glycosyltransferase family 4 protein [Gaiella sp.]
MNSKAHARRLVAPVARPLRRAYVELGTRTWPSHSRLFIAQEGADWVLAYESRQLTKLAAGLGIAVGPERWVNAVSSQGVFHESQFTLLLEDFERRGNRLGFAYFHGRPGTAGFPEFDVCYRRLEQRHEEIEAVQVTNEAMETVVLETGIAPEKVHRIPIGIDPIAFAPRTDDVKALARRELGLPESAFVVGSFQKDGVGWGEGLEPKLIKGPDVLVAAAERLRDTVPDLWFLLTGPSRGYVMTSLERAGIPYRHRYLPSLEAVSRAYEAIDLCIVASRDEGGPRAVLESMAIGVPLVTTRVGQAADLVRHGENGWMVEVEDVDGIVAWARYAAEAPQDVLEEMVRAGRRTVEENSYEALRPRWRRLLERLVSIPDADRA